LNNTKKYLEFPAPTTPLANIFFSFFIFISKETTFLRFINLALSFFCIFIFAKILDEYKIKDEYKILSFALFPYFVMLSQIVMTDVFALAISLISVYFFKKYQNKNKIKFLIFASIFACLSFFSRQYYIFIPIAHLIHLFLHKRKEIFYYIIFIAPIFVYVFLQKGLTPPQFRDSYRIEILPFKFFVIASAGFYFLPQIKKIKTNLNLLFISVLLSALIFIGLAKTDCSGISCRLISYKFLGFAFSSIGFSIIFDFVNHKIKSLEASLYLILFTLEQMFNSMPYDRYFLSIFWVFVIFSDKKMSKIQFFYFLAIASVYIAYKLFFAY